MNKKIECKFSLEVIAPDGLKKISESLIDSDLYLLTYTSGYNGKDILRSNNEEIIAIDMDSSDSETMFASGEISMEFDKAKYYFQKLNQILKRHNFPHRILIDNESGNETHRLLHAWNKNS